MSVFLLGGTGSIGTAILAALRENDDDVSVLCRSKASADQVRAQGARTVRGDLRAPDVWATEAAQHDAVIQVAATFSDDMGEVDARCMTALIQAASNRDEALRVLYTGGCWLYGDTGDSVATEESLFEPLPTFSWMVDNARMLLNADRISAAIVHPAMVYHQEGGVFERFVTQAASNQPVEIWGSPDTSWPLIHRDDLARSYCTLLRRPDLEGHFNAVAQEGVPVGRIVAALCAKFGNTKDPQVLTVEHVIDAHGAWAKGPTLDQHMSASRLKLLTGWRPLIPDYRISDIFA